MTTTASATSYLLSQLGYLAPALVVYLVAFVLAFVYMKRAPGPSTLALVGSSVLILATIAGAAAQAYLIEVA